MKDDSLSDTTVDKLEASMDKIDLWTADLEALRKLRKIRDNQDNQIWNAAIEAAADIVKNSGYY